MRRACKQADGLANSMPRATRITRKVWIARNQSGFVSVAADTSVGVIQLITVAVLKKVTALDPDPFRNIGVVHGAMTASILLKFGG